MFALGASALSGALLGWGDRHTPYPDGPPMLVIHNSGGMAQLNSTDALQTIHSGPVAGVRIALVTRIFGATLMLIPALATALLAICTGLVASFVFRRD